MSEHDEQRPLTRRERRLREMAETGALDLSELQQTPQDESGAAESQPADAQPVAAEDSGAAEAPEEIEISPFNEDGTPRSRREMRQLREAALAARAAAAPQEAEGRSAEPETELAPEPAEAPTAEPEQAESPASLAVEPEPEKVSAPEAVEDHADAGSPAANETADDSETEAGAESEIEVEAPDFDTLMAPPTEPFTVDELREAEQGGAAEAAELTEPEPSAAEAPEADPEVEASTPAEEPVPAAPEKPKRRFWQRNKSAAAAPAEPAAPEAAEPEAAAPEATRPADAEAHANADAELEAVVEAVEAFEGQVHASPETTQGVEPEAANEAPNGEQAAEAAPAGEGPAAEEPVAVEPAPEPAQAPETPQEKYSFPDIQPPEEWRSVFDDPASRSSEQPEGKGDFDDLISRAVAQEGAAGTSNTSALILPTMPDDTGGLSGPLGATGELYVTGSIELPKSLGETGGHSALHDSLQFEPITMPAPEHPTETTGEGPMPVSAKSAVSARMPAGTPLVAAPTKEKSKLPLVLGLSGGGLLIVVVGLGVWGAANGFFSG